MSEIDRNDKNILRIDLLRSSSKSHVYSITMYMQVITDKSYHVIQIYIKIHFDYSDRRASDQSLLCRSFQINFIMWYIQIYINWTKELIFEM